MTNRKHSPREPWMADAGRRLRVMRAERGWSQGRLANLAGISRTTISNIEGGLVWPGWQTMRKLGQALGEPNLTRLLMEER